MQDGSWPLWSTLVTSHRHQWGRWLLLRNLPRRVPEHKEFEERLLVPISIKHLHLQTLGLRRSRDGITRFSRSVLVRRDSNSRLAARSRYTISDTDASDNPASDYSQIADVIRRSAGSCCLVQRGSPQKFCHVTLWTTPAPRENGSRSRNSSTPPSVRQFTSKCSHYTAVLFAIHGLVSVNRQSN